MNEPHDAKHEQSRKRTDDATRESRSGATIDEADVGSEVGPTDAEVEEWASRVRKDRESWIAGPTEDEKRRWARRERRRRLLEEEADDFGLGFDIESDPIAMRAKRRVMLAREGMLHTMMNWPFLLWSRWIRAGRAFEADAFRPMRRSRVLFDDDVEDC